MRVKKGTPMGEVFKQYAEKKGLQEKSLSFARRGARPRPISGADRPAPKSRARRARLLGRRREDDPERCETHGLEEDSFRARAAPRPRPEEFPRAPDPPRRAARAGGTTGPETTRPAPAGFDASRCGRPPAGHRQGGRPVRMFLHGLGSPGPPNFSHPDSPLPTPPPTSHPPKPSERTMRPARSASRGSTPRENPVARAARRRRSRARVQRGPLVAPRFLEPGRM